MTRVTGIVRLCPDCGGILQSTEPERLTSVEVSAPDTPNRAAALSQCLLCGYEEQASPAVPALAQQS